MAVYRISSQEFELSELNEYRFKSEGSDRISPQEIIARFPNIVLSIPELEVMTYSSVLVAREFGTSRGPIDILMITDNAEVLLIETKLYRNPESHRTVVAQAIDYVKSLSEVDMEAVKSSLIQSKYSYREVTEKLFSKDEFCITLRKNLKTGNFKVLIVGDKIYPNLLGMVDSIQSAPHLAFTIYLIELTPTRYDDNNILLVPKVKENTVEVERSVIRLEIDYKNESYTIESSTPVRDSKGTRPTVTDEQFINSLSNPELADTMISFWNKWKSIGGDIRFGGVGFSAGYKFGARRIPIQFVLNNRFSLISYNYLKSYDVPDTIYRNYKERLKAKVPKAFDHIVANHVEMYYNTLTKEEIGLILDAAIEVAREIKGN